MKERARDFAILIGGIALFVGLVMLFDISTDSVFFYVLLFGTIITIKQLVVR